MESMSKVYVVVNEWATEECYGSEKQTTVFADKEKALGFYNLLVTSAKVDDWGAIIGEDGKIYENFAGTYTIEEVPNNFFYIYEEGNALYNFQQISITEYAVH